MTPEEINALPNRVREYIRDLATRCDPAGDVQRIAALEDQVNQLTTALSRNGDWREFIRLWLRADQTEDHGAIGVSSKALLEFAAGGDEPPHDRWPSDPADLARCLLTWGLLPHVARERARPVIVAFQTMVERRYPGTRGDLAHPQELQTGDVEGPRPVPWEVQRSREIGES